MLGCVGRKEGGRKDREERGMRGVSGAVMAGREEGGKTADVSENPPERRKGGAWMLLGGDQKMAQSGLRPFMEGSGAADLSQDQLRQEEGRTEERRGAAEIVSGLQRSHSDGISET